MIKFRYFSGLPLQTVKIGYQLVGTCPSAYIVPPKSHMLVVAMRATQAFATTGKRLETSGKQVDIVPC